jgi:hypothetical protein
MSQISPVPGTYQIMEASCHWFVVAEETQPARSVRAETTPRRRGTIEAERIVVFILVDRCVVSGWKWIKYGGWFNE